MRYMNTRFYLIILLSFILMSNTCNNGEGKLTLIEGETETRKLDGAVYSITVKHIRDNRCPKNVKCIRAGEALVDVDIVKSGGAAQSVQFCLGVDCRMHGAAISSSLPIERTTYEIRLESVTPYPTQNGTATASKSANFVVAKR